MKALSQFVPCLVLLVTVAPLLAFGQQGSSAKGDASRVHAPSGGKKDVRASSPCVTCLDQDTNPKRTTHGTGGTDPDRLKQKPADTKVKAQDVKVQGPEANKAPPAKPQP